MHHCLLRRTIKLAMHVGFGHTQCSAMKTINQYGGCPASNSMTHLSVLSWLLSLPLCVLSVYPYPGSTHRRHLTNAAASMLGDAVVSSMVCIWHVVKILGLKSRSLALS